MKITMPENLATPFAMLMKGVPEELQSDANFKDAVLVYLKFGGVTMARRFIETKTNYLNYAPLEIDTGFRFPRLQEADTDEDSNDDDDDDDDDDENGDETSDDDDDM